MPTYVIRDAEGREVRRETTLHDIIAPAVRTGETAELADDEAKREDQPEPQPQSEPAREDEPELEPEPQATEAPAGLASAPPNHNQSQE
jgi:hypothetical protein